MFNRWCTLLILVFLTSQLTSGHYRYPYGFHGRPNEPTFQDIMARRVQFDQTPRLINSDVDYIDVPMEMQEIPEASRPEGVNSYGDDPLAPSYDDQEPYAYRKDRLDDDQTSGSDQSYQSEPEPEDGLPDGCLRCLCEASSDCNPHIRCHTVGPNDYYCGPFQINYAYWSDAGQPGQHLNNPMDFEDCMGDIECSIDTVNGYMKKWSRDCNGDGQTNCEDFARIHKTGPFGCNSSWVLRTPYYDRFKECYLEY